MQEIIEMIHGILLTVGLLDLGSKRLATFGIAGWSLRPAVVKNFELWIQIAFSKNGRAAGSPAAYEGSPSVRPFNVTDLTVFVQAR